MVAKLYSWGEGVRVRYEGCIKAMISLLVGKALWSVRGFHYRRIQA